MTNTTSPTDSFSQPSTPSSPPPSPEPTTMTSPARSKTSSSKSPSTMPDEIVSTPLVAAIDPRHEARVNATASRHVQEARRSILEMQISQLTTELQAVNDTIFALGQLETLLDEAMAQAQERAFA